MSSASEQRIRLSAVVVVGSMVVASCHKPTTVPLAGGDAAAPAASSVAVNAAPPLPALERLLCPSEMVDAGSADNGGIGLGRIDTLGGGREVPTDPRVDPKGGACADGDVVCDELETPIYKDDTCGPANVNLRSAAKEIAAGVTKERAVSPADARVREHLDLNPAENERLQKLGFAVIDRLRPGGYAHAYHSIFQDQLPVYVSVDSILHAVFVANDTLSEQYEVNELWPRLVRAIKAMRHGLAKGGVRARYGAAVEADVEIYLRVAFSLLLQSPMEEAEDVAVFGATPDAAARRADADELYGLAKAAESLVTDQKLFGRARAIDFTPFTPRGRYATYSGPTQTLPLSSRASSPATRLELRGGLADYFRGAMWLSRIEFNLVSRGSRSSHAGTPDPSETPHEARVALALSELIRDTGQKDNLAFVQRAWDRLAGPREDVPLLELATIARDAKVTPADADPVPKLAAKIGEGYKRTVRTHFTAEGAGELPVITTLLGPRIARDTRGATKLVKDDVPDRALMHAADFAYLLGNDRAKTYLAADLGAFPALAKNLDEARAIASKPGGQDLYESWLGAIRALNAPAPEATTLPSFMKTPAFADLRLDSTIVAFAQLRHNYVLMNAQPYDTWGCEIPDGYVEPAVEVYDGLLRYTDKLSEAFMPTTADARKTHDQYIKRVRTVLTTLRTIAQHERAGKPLTDAEQRWIAMVAEHIPVGGYGGDSGGPPSYTGWYFDLFPDRSHGAKASGELVTDVYTSTQTNTILYLGAGGPRLGVFKVDTNGPPRLMVGPIATGYEHLGELRRRFEKPEDRDEGGDFEAVKGAPAAPWAASYTAPASAEPDLAIQTKDCDGKLFVRATTPARIANVRLRFLDHHGDTLLTKDMTLEAGDTNLELELPKDKRAWIVGHGVVEGVAVRIGDFRGLGGGTVYEPEWPIRASVAAYQPTSLFAFGRMRTVKLER
ncbi:MAG: DUF3160 domain-containing protein [Labilithrix sp.]|nr:DUF3160 domain-containing protein [Labilithrix sp.]MCW5811520.1 DUF3160 domain-containing protein [Labilithrix sp.]